MALGQITRQMFSGRPWWMNAMMVFCAFMAVVFTPYDMIATPVSEAEEVWLGFVLTGWYARLTEPLHLAIYAIGFCGFLKMKPWMHPWAAVYAFQVGIALAVFALLYRRDAPERIAIAFSIGACWIYFGVVLLRARALFQPDTGAPTASGSEEDQAI